MLVAAVGCSDDSAVGPAVPAGVAPAVELTVGFDDPPLEGILFLRPDASTRNWRYTIDFGDDGKVDHEGVIRDEIGFRYRFEGPGVHRIAVVLEGTASPIRIERRVVVNDPAGTEILAERALPRSENSIFEGIALDRAGRFLYVGDFWDDLLYQVDAQSLDVQEGPLELEDGPEGLSVAPGDSLLYVLHKRFHLSVVAIPMFEVRRVFGSLGGFFIRLIDETHALLSGSGLAIQLVNVDDGAVEATGAGQWHFAVAPDGQRIAVLDRIDGVSVRLLALPALNELATYPIPDLGGVDAVAYDPDGSRLYVMGRDQGGVRFVLLDALNGEILESLPLVSAGCSIFCAANPVTVFANGRFVAFEQIDGVIIVDTSIDLPRFKAKAAGSVAANPERDAFYVLRSDGLLSKLTVAPLSSSRSRERRPPTVGSDEQR